MGQNLLIVESPSKAKTLKKYLGKDFEILASYGHVRALVRKDGSVDVDHNFDMKYQLIEKNKKHVDAIIAAVKVSDNIYLATDPDREGEAISWHLLEILKAKKLFNAKKQFKRVVFHEITESAVKAAVANPRDIDTNLVHAQQARTALDYLVGFNLSPLLWRKIRQGLSAGRVQSPALRLICEREKEIAAFTAQEYWTIHLDTHKNGENQQKAQPFTAKLWQLAGKKLDQFSIPNENEQLEVLKQLNKQSATVIKVEKKRKQRNAAAPFTTSTLQQEAVRKLGMTTDRAMRTAQQLYEGIDIGRGEVVGLITYMRTDSVSLANEAINEIRDYIGQYFSAEYLPSSPFLYKSRAKNAQEAHEAIRPTSIMRSPDSVRGKLTPDQMKLYEMIWKRTLACQMNPAKFDMTSVDIAVGSAANLFRVNGQVLIFPGFIAVYQEDGDDVVADDEEGRLPPLAEGETLPVDKLYGVQHFTQAPPRYTEASLVKALEEFGIGRPSTYASIIFTLKDREYAVLDKKRFVPTDTGMVVNKFLTEHFTQYVDYHFTAKLEDTLDEIASGNREWIPVLSEFWTDFDQQVEKKKSLSRKEVTQEAMDEVCPKCSNPLVIRLGRRGRFVGCSTYPECDYTRGLNDEQNEEETTSTVIEGRECPLCASALQIKSGPYGKFIGCTAYPKCKFIEPLEKPASTGVNCPECKKGSLIERKSRYGKMFYSCNTYPSCKYAVWNPPIKEPCPQCQWPIMTLKTTKRRGTEKVCPQKECGYAEVVTPPEK